MQSGMKETGVVLRSGGKSRSAFHTVSLEKAARLAGESFAWEDNLHAAVLPTRNASRVLWVVAGTLALASIMVLGLR